MKIESIVNSTGIFLMVFILCAAVALADSDKDAQVPAAGKSSTSSINNYGITGENLVGKSTGEVLGSPAENQFGYFFGLDFTVALTTNTIASITNNSAITGGNVIDDNGVEHSVQGICWGTSPMPEKVLGSYVEQPWASNGSYSMTMTGLAPGAVYYVRAYAIDAEENIFYGDQKSFTTIPTLPEWGLIAMVSIFAIIGGAYVTKRFV